MIKTLKGMVRLPIRDLNETNHSGLLTHTKDPNTWSQSVSQVGDPCVNLSLSVSDWMMSDSFRYFTFLVENQK